MEVWPHPMMDDTTWSSCPLATLGGTRIPRGGEDLIGGGPSADRWLTRAFRALRVANNGGTLADVLGPLSAAGVDAVCTITAERDTMQREAIERQQSRVGK